MIVNSKFLLYSFLFLGLTLVLGEVVILIFRPLTNGNGIGMTFWLEDGSSINLVVGGILYQEGIVDETISCITDYQVIEKSLFNARFDSVYSQSKVENAILNTLAYYHSSPSYNIQLGAALLLRIISLLLAIAALFNTFAVTMSVRSKEFNGLKLIGAKKNKFLK